MEETSYPFKNNNYLATPFQTTELLTGWSRPGHLSVKDTTKEHNLPTKRLVSCNASN
jgi:hypothetical protein